MSAVDPFVLYQLDKICSSYMKSKREEAGPKKLRLSNQRFHAEKFRACNAKTMYRRMAHSVDSEEEAVRIFLLGKFVNPGEWIVTIAPVVDSLKKKLVYLDNPGYYYRRDLRSLSREDVDSGAVVTLCLREVIHPYTLGVLSVKYEIGGIDPADEFKIGLLRRARKLARNAGLIVNTGNLFGASA